MITFKIFGTADEAEEIRKLFADNSIEVEIEDDSLRANPALKSTPYSGEYRVMIYKEDLAKAREITRNYFAADFETLGSDYYLFSFSDHELEEILRKSYEWSLFDEFLAEKILKERGKQPDQDEIEKSFVAHRVNIDLVEKRPWAMIIFGYIFSLGFIGLLLGGLLVNSRKTLPSGEKVYSYSQPDRNHGFIILGLGILSMLYFVMRYILLIEIF